MSKVIKYTCRLCRYNYTHVQLNTRHFNIIFRIFFWGGRKNLSLSPGASYYRYAMYRTSNINKTHTAQILQLLTGIKFSELRLLTHIKFSELRLTNPAGIRNVINSCNTSSCHLDPIPTWLLKCCIEELLPLFKAIFSNSLSNGTFPSEFKSALIRRLLKKPNLDIDELKKYRPVSNLHFCCQGLRKACHDQTRGAHGNTQFA